MPIIRTTDGVSLHVEEAGTGTPIVFVHEFAGAAHSWEPQLRFFARRHRCVAFNARGYPPSDVPTDPAAYSQHRAADDIADVIRALDLAPAHVVGISMGAFATLHLGLRHPTLARSLVAAGVGYGSDPKDRHTFHADTDVTIARLRAEGMWSVSQTYGRGPARLQFEDKDPRGHAEFLSQLAAHSTDGSALTMGGVQRRRPSLYDLEAEFRALTLPTLVICGDEDDLTLEPGIFLKRAIPASGLLVLPKCGHTINLEEPDAFNRAVLDFLTAVEADRWPPRNPATVTR